MKNGLKTDKYEAKCWYKDDELHREDGPAIECLDGTKKWYQNGLLHRENGPAVEWWNKDKFWYKDGMLHREDGPAIESYGSKWNKQWFQNGERHREDGPALECYEYNIWFYRGKRIECSSTEEFLKIIKLRLFW